MKGGTEQIEADSQAIEAGTRSFWMEADRGVVPFSEGGVSLTFSAARKTTTDVLVKVFTPLGNVTDDMLASLPTRNKDLVSLMKPFLSDKLSTVTPIVLDSCGEVAAPSPPLPSPPPSPLPAPPPSPVPSPRDPESSACAGQGSRT